MLKIRDNIDIKKIKNEYNFETVKLKNVLFLILKGKKVKINNDKQQEFISINTNLRVIECYGFEILNVIYDMTNKNYLEVI